tara:strand:+ start:768 stop:1013 length:246 start_codon:yes stop_codon:yes gene_type:complete
MNEDQRFEQMAQTWTLQKNQKRYLENPLTCINPECSQDQQFALTGRLEQLTPSYVFQHIECRECGATWRDIYVLSKAEVQL